MQAPTAFNTMAPLSDALPARFTLEELAEFDRALTLETFVQGLRDAGLSEDEIIGHRFLFRLIAPAKRRAVSLYQECIDDTTFTAALTRVVGRYVAARRGQATAGDATVPCALGELAHFDRCLFPEGFAQGLRDAGLPEAEVAKALYMFLTLPGHERRIVALYEAFRDPAIKAALAGMVAQHAARWPEREAP